MAIRTNFAKQRAPNWEGHEVREASWGSEVTWRDRFRLQYLVNSKSVCIITS